MLDIMFNKMINLLIISGAIFITELPLSVIQFLVNARGSDGMIYAATHVMSRINYSHTNHANPIGVSPE